jgi:hypothetical protein
MFLQTQKYYRLSLTARLGVALNCFERFCDVAQIRDQSIDDYLSYLWQFPCIVNAPGFGEWEAHSPMLVDLALSGGDLPLEIMRQLEGTKVSHEEFRLMIEAVVAIIFDSFWTDCDEPGSRKWLDRVVRVAAKAGVQPPPIRPFSISLYRDCGGWGFPITPEQRDMWRYSVHARKKVQPSDAGNGHHA